MIPGPREPKETINTYLKPFIEELQELWSGVVLPYETHPLKQLCIRGAIICCSSDIPATRKLCGFLGHSANLGCSRCLKQFVSRERERERGSSSSSKKMDYLGYDWESWPPQNLSDHREQSFNHLRENTCAKKKEIEETYGLRYSSMIELPYFNSIQHAVVDPMHNFSQTFFRSVD